MRLAEIKDGFFGFLVQVFDSWAGFLRLRIEPRTEEGPAPKDPFVSGPPDHWLEMTAGLSFTDWGTPEGAEGAEGPESEEGEAPVLPDLPEPLETVAETVAETVMKTAAEPESVRGAYSDATHGTAPPAMISVPAARSSFIDKRVATPEEAEFVRRRVRTPENVENAESRTRFLSFSDKGSETKSGAKFVRAQKPAEQLPARFFEITPAAGTGSGTEGERSAPSVRAPEIKAEIKAETKPDLAKSGFVRVAPNNENAIRKPAVSSPKAGPETKDAFVGKGRKTQHVPAEFPKRNVAAVPAGFSAFSEPHTSPVPGSATAGKADIYRHKISDDPAFVNSPSVSFPVHPADFPQRIVSPPVGHAGAGENVFSPSAGRTEIGSVFPPGKNTGAQDETFANNSSAPSSKWADLPELDLNNATGAPEAENLRRRHLTLLNREQKGERWSV